MLSVIVPVYNVERFLPRCIDSIINQTYKNLEIILVNDCSTDKSGLICEEYVRKDSRIILIQKSVNEGVGSARNAALDIAKGKYIAFVDSDDWIKNDFCEVLIDIMIQNKADIVQCQHYTVYEDHIKYHKETQKIIELNNIEAVDRFLRNNTVSPVIWDKLYIRSKFKSVRFSSVKYGFEDVEIIPKVMITAKKIICIDQPKYYYRQRSDSFVHQPLTIEKAKCSLALCNERIQWVRIHEPKLIQVAKTKYITRLISIIYTVKRHQLENLDDESTKALNTLFETKNSMKYIVYLVYKLLIRYRRNILLRNLFLIYFNSFFYKGLMNDLNIIELLKTKKEYFDANNIT